MILHATYLALAATVALGAAAAPAGPKMREPNADEKAKILAAAPDRPAARPTTPRKLLVFSRCYGYKHTAIPFGRAAVAALAKKTGAFDVVLSNDQAMFETDNLKQFDAVFLNNTNNEIFLPENYAKLPPAAKAKAETYDKLLKASLVAWLKGGKGLAVIHAGLASFRKWPEFGTLIGGRFQSHPWNAGSTVTLKLDEPTHPVARAFGGRSFVVKDEIYQFKAPYSRDLCRVLLSIDTTKTNMKVRGLRRKDNDFAITWVKPYGKGRVFYCALGHQHDLFWNTTILTHFLDGIQYVLGDLKVPDAPVGAARASIPMATLSATPLADKAKAMGKTKNAYAWKKTDKSLAMVKGETVIWQFNFDKTEGKPYFHPLCTTDGTLLTALRPKDHPWHRALWFSWKHINGLNYWEENRKGLSQGRTEIKAIKIQAPKGRAARIDMALSFHPPDKPEVMSEKCIIDVSQPNADGIYTIDWKSTFTAGEKDVVLDRTPIPGEKGGRGYGGYAGLSLRLARELRKWPAVDSEGRKDMKIHGRQAKWMGFGDKAGRGGVFIEARKSTLGAVRWYIAKGMPYFSPAVLFAKPFTIKAGKSIELAYTITVYPAKAGK